MKRKEIQLDKEEQRLFNESLKKYVQSKGYSMEDIPNEIGNKLIMKFVSNCKRCELCRNKSVLPLYNSSPRAIIINQVSGSQEEKKEIILPTTYPAGKVFDKYLNNLGLKREEVYLTSSVFCSKNKYLPTIECNKKCRLWKDLEFEYMNVPDVIILLGEGSLQSFYNDFSLSMNKEFGEMFVTNIKNKDRLIIPVYHPVTYLREEPYREQIDYVLKLVGELIKQDKVKDVINEFNKTSSDFQPLQ